MKRDTSIHPWKSSPETAIIRSIQLDNRNEPIVPLAEKVIVNGNTLDGDDYGINIDAAYQREPVWGAERKRNLIRSILMGLPIGALIFNERKYPEWRVCVDGKQRLLAVRDFITDDLAVPAEWFTSSSEQSALYFHTIETAAGPYVTWGCLTQTGKRIFDNMAVTVTHTARMQGGDVEARERELFALVNYGGVPQGERDEVTA